VPVTHRRPLVDVLTIVQEQGHHPCGRLLSHDASDRGEMMSQSEVSELVRLVDETSKLLEGLGETHWAGKLRTSIEAAAIDPWTMLRWFGGMGSLTDLYLSKINGHAIATEDEASTNEELAQLTARIYELAYQLERASPSR
jgi:hypothetical protein